MLKVTALIMAGGRGERFWPKSRMNLPKQFLSLTSDGKTMLQKTVERILPLADIEDIFIVTNGKYKNLTLEQLRDLPEENVILEPVGRNTAPCIGLGAIHIEKKYSDSIMLVLPADSLIQDVDNYVNTLKNAIKLVEEKNGIVTLGIKPSYPETGYGYIKYKPDMELHSCYAVDAFCEKPCLEKAKEYVDSGFFLWNAGNFVFKTSMVLSKLQQFEPDIYNRLQRIKAAIGEPEYFEILESEFREMTPISIDYAVMERSDNIYTVKCTFDWDDVGSWLALERINGRDSDGNTARGDVISYNTKNCIVQSESRLVSLVGVEDLVVVETKDAVLICHKEKTADIKMLLQSMKEKNRKEL